MLGASRVLYSIGKENKTLGFFGKVLPKRKTPARALLVAAAVAGGVSLLGDVKKAALVTTFFVFISFLIVNVTLIYLRKTEKDIRRPFKIPGNVKDVPVITVLSIIMVTLLMGYTIYDLVVSFW